jgi:putative transposase
MPRIARVVIPGVPHHVVQRARRGAKAFLSDDDRRRYLEWLRRYAADGGLAVWAYCLMPDHVHLVAVPREADSLERVFKPLARRHSRHVNRTRGIRGRLWQGRPQSCPLDEPHLWAAVRYVERNPVRAGRVIRAERYSWSSAAHHAGRRHDGLVSGDLEARGRVKNWARWLQEGDDEEMMRMLRLATRTGRPAGDAAFIARLESLLGRTLAARGRGRPRKGGQ